MTLCSMKQEIETTHAAEEWRPVKGYEGLYEVSNLGRVRNVQKNRILCQSTVNGYKQVSLYIGGKTITSGVHRLVAFAFCEGYFYSAVVNHKNEIRDDNRPENLEWCTKSYNARYNDAHLKGQEKVHTKTKHDDHREYIGKKLRDLRRKNKLSFWKASTSAGISIGTLQRIESGVTSVSFDTIETLANIYGYSFDLTKLKML